MSEERLNKFLARRGIASRRGADQLISAGRVSINGVAAGLGTTVDPDVDSVAVDGADIDGAAEVVTIILNKPLGVVSTRRDPQHRRTVMHLVERIPGLVPVGRLDVDSRGLLLLSTDGELTHRLTHPRHGVTKVYHVTIKSTPTLQQMTRLRTGVDLDDGFAAPLGVEIVDHAQDAVIAITMGEGRKREVRRICAAVGLDVVDLKRVSLGPLTLAGLAEGTARRLTDAEARALYGAVGMHAPKPTVQTSRP